MRAKAFALIALTALVASVAVPAVSNASFTDSVFIIGKWSYEETETEGDNTRTSTSSFRFDVGGGGKSMYESESENDGYTSQTQYESEFEWKIEGDILYIYHPSTYAASKADPDWDAASQFKMEFDSAFSKLTLLQKNSWTGEFETEGTQYKKSGSVCGTVCPFCFMYFAVAPLALFAAVAVRRLKK